MIDEYKKDYIKGKKVVKRIFLILIFVSLVLIGIRLLKDIAGMVLLPVKKVVVYGNRFIGNKEVIRLIGLGPTTSMLNIKGNKASELLRKDPRVETAVVVKVYPDTIKVYLKEKPVMLPLFSGGKWYALSGDGVVLGEIKNEYINDAPGLQILNYDDIKIGYKLDNFLVQETLKAIQKLKSEDNRLFKQINKIVVSRSGIYINMNNDKYRVYLGDSINLDTFKRLKALLTVLKNSKEAEAVKQISINMSFAHASVKIGE